MNALHTLAQLYSLELGFDDVFGQRQEASDDALRCVLKAAGVNASDDQAVAASLQQRLNTLWQEGTQPFTVYRHGRNHQAKVPVKIPVDAMEKDLHWQLWLEDGGGLRCEGHVTPADLEQGERSPQEVALATQQVFLSLPLDLPLGYHTLKVSGAAFAEQTQQATLLVAPEKAYFPTSIPEDKGVWGFSVQLYSLLSQQNWGMGDFTDLKQLMRFSGKQGASVVGLNPLHALYPHNAYHISPYSPSSRLFFNHLYLDVQAVEEFASCPEAQTLVETADFQEHLRQNRENKLIDYPHVAHLKNQVLALLFQSFLQKDVSTQSERYQAFETYRHKMGERLQRLAIYQALHEQRMAQDETQWGWPVWPVSLQRPDTPEVAAFAKDNAERVQYYVYLQFLVDEQLDQVEKTAKDAGLPVGLYLDLAVGADRAGVDLWCDQDLYSFKASLGCPPDAFNQMGQDWGLPPMLPEAMTTSGYQAFIQMLRFNMAHAGALRMDHALALFRAFWVPTEGGAKNGAYVRYPSEHLLAIIALESQRSQCIVIGEDLGTVPAFVTEALGDWGVLSYKVFFFEKQGNNEIQPPEAYPKQALVTVSTHDLPTLKGYWEGADITLRDELSLFPNPEALQQEWDNRPNERSALLRGLAAQGLLPEAFNLEGNANPHLSEAVLEAVHRFLARTPSKLQMVQLEDVLMGSEQMNMPGTTDQHPNWRRRLHTPLEAMFNEASVLKVTQALRQEPKRFSPSAASLVV